MRPLRLELEGFASFRANTVVEFSDDTEVFVLTGPTGAGKSSLIDAIGFALYGSVPRYDNEKAVEPVITKGALEAKVRLDFALGAERYTVTRVVRRQAGRVTTKEARLERNGGSMPVEGARQLDDAIEQLLGLSFDQFTKCVVLPQGDFSRFLHEKVGPRREMLIRLVGAEFLVAVQQEANQRAKVAVASAQMCRARLEGELANATQEALDAGRARVAELVGLLEAIEADGPRLEGLALRQADALREADAAREAARALDGVGTPAGIAALAARLEEARANERRALELAEAAAEDVRQAREARDELPWDAGQLKALEDAHRDLAKVTASREAAEEALTLAIAAEGEAEAARAKAATAVQAATDARESVLSQNYAYRLAQKLQPGDACPVCGETLSAAPRHEPPPGLNEANEAKAAAEAELQAAERAAQKAHGARTQRQAELNERTKHVAQLESRLEGQPSPDELAELRLKVESSDRQAREAEQRARQAVQLQQAARAEREAVQRDEQQAWSAFEAAYARVAPFGPPTLERRALSEAWDALARWCMAELPARLDAGQAATATATALAGERDGIVLGQRERCARSGVDATLAAPRDACRDALARAQQACERIAEQITLALEVRRELREHEEAASIAQTLAQCLKGDRSGFQNWYVERVLRRLVRDASQRLEQLSSNQYALALDANSDFAVIDHTNADETRPVRTLSGGETFLASLALALALSDNIADMAANGAAKLEAIFLDEGFGTLDPDTLDTVAAALEELGARGRMVGVVTHVAALADRLPIRYDVRKDGRTSQVTRTAV